MTDVQHLEVLQGGQGPEERAARLDEGAAEIASGDRRSVLGRDRFLLTASAVLMVLGLAAILLGWAGASRTTIAEEQVRPPAVIVIGEVVAVAKPEHFSRAADG